MDSETSLALLFVGAIAAIYLITRRWFWVIVGGIGGLAAIFFTLAFIVHFQILAALGCFALAIICWIIIQVAAYKPKHI
jgi:hypothetical protein